MGLHLVRVYNNANIIEHLPIGARILVSHHGVKATYMTGIRTKI